VILRPFAAPAVQWILYGGLMIAIVFVLPQGIVPAVERWIENWTQPKRKPPGVIWVGSSKPGDAK
jgi:branched-chain amino acid transport system permease protein